jgi:hypothetical protein
MPSSLGYIRMEADLGDEGQHQFDLRCFNQDGVEVLPKMSGQFEVPQGGGNTVLLLNFSVAFPKFGPYKFILRVDNIQLDDWMIHAALPAGKTPGA